MAEMKRSIEKENDDLSEGSNLAQEHQEKTSSPVEDQEAAATSKVEPQDGGLDAWLQVLASFFIFFNIWGLVNAFGAYEEYYTTTLLSSYSTSAISWIGTVDGFLLVLGGTLTGPIYDHGYFRTMLVVGSFLVVFGVMMLSLADQYYQIFLAQGICVGLGSGILYVPSLALIAAAFSKNRGLAIGVATSGGSVGGVVFPIMFRRLQTSIGFAWATRAIGFLALGCFLISSLIMLPKAPQTSKKSRRMFDASALTEWPFMMFTLGGFLIFLAFWVPFFYITSFSLRIVGATPDLSFYMLAITNASSAFGRIIPGFVADRVGPLQTLIVSAAIGGVLILAWIAVHDVAGLVVWAIVWGFFSGVLVSVPAAVVPLLCPSPGVIGARLGMAWAGAAIGILIGNPIAGAIASSDLSHFSHAQIFAGVVMMAGAASDLVPLMHILRRNRKQA